MEANGSARGLCGAVFITGAAVMVVELLGTRLLAPYYGTGIQVWSAMISVTLLALSVGYWTGGTFADRWGSRAFFWALPGCAALPVYFLPVLSRHVLACTEPLGPRGGALASAGLLFGVPLAVLGMVIPYAVRLHPGAARAIGRSSGTLFAVSTFGSIVGTLAAGFLLIPAVGVSRIFQLTACMLLSVSAAGFLGIRRHRLSGGTAVLLAASACWMVRAHHAVAGGPGPEQAGLRHETDSFYSHLSVWDTPEERWLLMDGVLHTHVLRGPCRDPVRCEYVRAFDLLPALRPGARTCLLIGMGGGSVLKTYEPFNLRIDVVEIDPEVRATSERFFGPFRLRGSVHIQDGRAFLRRCRQTYDLIILDVVSADSFPEHLCTVEFFREVQRALAPGGVLGVNSMGFWGGRALPSLQRTLKAVFPHVLGCTAHVTSDYGNVVFMASSLPLEIPPEEADRFRGRIVAVPQQGGILLTDDFNPLNLDNAGMAWDVRGQVRDVLDRSPH